MYNMNFYDNMLKKGVVNNLSSAKVIVPLLVDLFHPQSVVDVGCAIGIWLDMFKQSGNIQVLGYDGYWVEESKLLIKKEEFVKHNLKQRIITDRKFDLAISLEVAEHISKKHANDFVDNLVQLSDCICFSAAIPYQGGTHHVNEQWQSYWIRKFEKRGYQCYDYIRPAIWNNKKVGYFYAQNTFLFINEKKIHELGLYDILQGYQIKMADCVHPALYNKNMGLGQDPSMKQIIDYQKKIIIALENKVSNYIKKDKMNT